MPYLWSIMHKSAWMSQGLASGSNAPTHPSFELRSNNGKITYRFLSANTTKLLKIQWTKELLKVQKALENIIINWIFYLVSPHVLFILYLNAIIKTCMLNLVMYILRSTWLPVTRIGKVCISIIIHLSLADNLSSTV